MKINFEDWWVPEKSRPYNHRSKLAINLPVTFSIV